MSKSPFLAARAPARPVTVSSSRLFGNGGPPTRMLPMAQISPSPTNARQYFDPDALAGLAQSIASVGMAQPIIVRELGPDQFQIVGGERRYRAHKLLNRDEIWAVILSGDPEELSLVENLQRADLTPFETAQAWERLMTARGWTQEQIGQYFGISHSSISRSLRILELPQEIRDDWLTCADKPTLSVLVQIARAPAEEQQALWEMAKSGQSVREIARLRSEKAEPEDVALQTSSQATPSAGTPQSWGRLTASARKMVVQAAALKAVGAPLSPEQRKTLQELQDAIALVLAE